VAIITLLGSPQAVDHATRTRQLDDFACPVDGKMSSETHIEHALQLFCNIDSGLYLSRRLFHHPFRHPFRHL
jgi:hypothetical protein